MYSVEHSVEAQNDLAEIWVYTLRKWGADQADKYIDELLARCAQLEHHPKLGRPKSQISAGYFALRMNQHTAYYTISGSTISIVRVLHDSMIPEKYL